jgi:molybdate transport system substrate-binding protein
MSDPHQQTTIDNGFSGLFNQASMKSSSLAFCVGFHSIRNWLLCVLILLFVGTSIAEELSIAAAADLNFALRDIASAYERETGNTLKISYGSSGNFFTQIQNGAPFDIFFSADIDFPRQLEAAGIAQPGTFFAYATGKIVLWVPSKSKLDLTRGMNVMRDPSIKKIAIANPKHAPYGRTAEAALRKSGVYDAVQSKLVLGENISQTAQFVETGNADIGILALSLASAPTMQSHGRYVEIPADLYPALQQAAVVLKRSSHQLVARSFFEFLKGPAAQQILRSYGFSPPVL